MSERHAHGSAHPWRNQIPINGHQQQQSGQHRQPEMSCNHVFDRSLYVFRHQWWSIASLKFSQENVNDVTKLTLSFHFTQDPIRWRNPFPTQQHLPQMFRKSLLQRHIYRSDNKEHGLSQICDQWQQCCYESFPFLGWLWFIDGFHNACTVQTEQFCRSCTYLEVLKVLSHFCFEGQLCVLKSIKERIVKCGVSLILFDSINVLSF